MDDQTKRTTFCKPENADALENGWTVGGDALENAWKVEIGNENNNQTHCTSLTRQMHPRQMTHYNYKEQNISHFPFSKKENLGFVCKLFK